MKTLAPTAAYTAFHSDVADLLKKHAGHLDAIEMLAVASHLVGQLIAFQDRRTMTTEKAMAVVIKNIEGGNAHALEDLNTPAGAA